MFPLKAVAHIIVMTNLQLFANKESDVDEEELFCFFGLIILGTRYEFTMRQSLWSTESITRFQPAPDFLRTGMCRNRFDVLWRHIRFSY